MNEAARRDLLDEGQWMVTQVDQLVATFFLPLVEPLALPSGSPIETYLPMNKVAIDLLTRSGLDLAFSPLHDPRLPPVFLSEGQGMGGEEHQNWANKCTLSSSLMVHQVAASPWSRSGLDAVALVAAAASSEMYDPASLRLSTSSPPQRGPSGPRLRLPMPWRKSSSNDYRDPLAEYLTEAGELGVGEITVVEAAVDLRLIGDAAEWLADVDEPLDIAHPPTGPDILLKYPDLWPFARLEASTVTSQRLVERLYWALGVAIEDVRNLQKAYHKVTRHPITLVTRERLPHTLPVTLRCLRDMGRADATRRVLMSVNENLWSLLRPPPLEQEQIRALQQARRQVDGHVFSAHLDLHREADAALRRQGDPRVAVLLAAVAAESLLDELLLHLKWEEGQTPEAAAEAWIEGVASRVKREYSSRLGGQWDLRSGPVGRWAEDVAAVRHRVVHAAYVPNVDEAQAAIAAANELVTYACDRLATAERLTRYPRTALTLTGENGLRRRGVFSRRLVELQESQEEPDWGETFARWRAAHNRVRQDRLGKPRRPSPDDAYLLLVRRVDGSVYACLHHRSTFLAAQIGIDALELPERQTDSLEALLNRIAASTPDSAVSVLVERTPETELTNSAPWSEEYHLVPLAGVMVDRSDLTAPVTYTIE